MFVSGIFDVDRIVVTFIKCNLRSDLFQYSVFKVQIHQTNVWRMEMERFELLTPCLQGRCSPNWATPPDCGTKNNLFNLMGLSGLEPPTSRLSGVRSNRLSYKPRFMSKWTTCGVNLFNRSVWRLRKFCSRINARQNNQKINSQKPRLIFFGPAATYPPIPLPV